MPLPIAGEPRPARQGTPEVTAAGVEPEPVERTHRRFDRAARLLGEEGLRRLGRARVVIFGMGGVGSFAAEALARSGVGTLVLVDFDDVCVTNTNRQLHAMRGTIGRPKVEIMAERLARISPLARIEPVRRFYQAEDGADLLEGPIDHVIDAIDSLKAKAHLLHGAIARGLPTVSSMGAAGRLDPTRVRTADLSRTEHCPLARDVRRLLRVNHGLEVRRSKPLGVTAVYSDEPAAAPERLSYDEEDGFRCVCPNRDNGVYTCDRRTRIDGSAAFVTGTFGLVAASVAVRAIAGR